MSQVSDVGCAPDMLFADGIFIHDDDTAVNLAFHDGAAALLCLVALEMAGDELTMTYLGINVHGCRSQARRRAAAAATLPESSGAEHALLPLLSHA